MNKYILLIVLITYGFSVLFAQEERHFKVGCIAFYNVENLFDTIDTPGIIDSDFTPDAPKQWNTERYFFKIDRLAEVISKIGIEMTGAPPGVVGLCEVENAEVLYDLVADEQIRRYDYQVVHYPGPDRRGIDCALIYRPDVFTLKSSVSYRLDSEKHGFITRDQLLVTGYYDNEKMAFIVVHYPSRRRGEKMSRPRRIATADLTRYIVDSLLNDDPNAKIVVMGDLNDNPNDVSVKKHLNSTGKIDRMTGDQLFNPMYDLFRQGIGSLAFRDQWSLFDMILVSKAFVDHETPGYKFHRAYIFNRPFLVQKEGRFKGYPFRTYVGDTFAGGYSDHFPAYMFIIKEVEK